MIFFTFLPFALGISIPTENSVATEIQPMDRPTFDHDIGRQRREVGCSPQEIHQYLNDEMDRCVHLNINHEEQG